MFRDEAGWIRVYKEKGAYWEHSGNPLCPHARFTSGNDSDLFFNSRLVIIDEVCLREAASDLVDLYVLKEGNIGIVDCVVGPQTGATKLSEFIADEIGKRRGYPCRWASPKKGETGSDRIMIFDDPEHTVLPGDVILQCEDVISTGRSVELAGDAAVELGGRLLSFLLVLVNRSGLLYLDHISIVALIYRPASMWAPGECPLCAQGSVALRPKDPDAWARLNATY